MKILKNILSLTLIIAFALSCKNEAKPEVKTIEDETALEATKKLDPNAKYAKAEFTIEGMTCAVGCAATIQKKLGKMDGVKSAIVDFDKRIAMVEYNEATVTPNSLEATVTGVSDIYKVKDMKTVDAFSKSKTCDKDCKKACCANKLKDSKKDACAKDCKKACCVKKEEA